MKKYQLLFILALTSLGLFFSCNENTVKEDLTVAKGFDYFPLEIGKYITYRLDSIIYRPESGMACSFIQDTMQHFLREEVVDIFVDNEQDTTYIIERYTRQDETQDWQVTDVWNAKRTDTHVERVEENLRFIKLVFPVQDGVTWNGNSFFGGTLDSAFTIGGETIDFYRHWSDEYEYNIVDAPETIGGITFDSVMTVVQSEPNDNQIVYRYSIEKYARGIGLIYKEMQILDTQCCGNDLSECLNVPWLEKAEKGLFLRQEVLDYN